MDGSRSTGGVPYFCDQYGWGVGTRYTDLHAGHRVPRSSVYSVRNRTQVTKRKRLSSAGKFTELQAAARRRHVNASGRSPRLMVERPAKLTRPGRRWLGRHWPVERPDQYGQRDADPYGRVVVRLAPPHHARQRPAGPCRHIAASTGSHIGRARRHDFGRHRDPPRGRPQRNQWIARPVRNVSPHRHRRSAHDEIQRL